MRETSVGHSFGFADKCIDWLGGFNAKWGLETVRKGLVPIWYRCMCSLLYPLENFPTTPCALYPGRSSSAARK